MRKPICIDLYAGLGGWTEGFLAEGWDVVGFDNHRHMYADHRYPAQLVLQDVLTIHGSQFRNADCIVASPPCQRYSYMAMPWSRAKREVRWQRWERDSVFGDRLEGLRALFDACFRIQREACEAAGRHIPMVVENVKGAQPWVGPAKANFGSFYFWGDVAMVGGAVTAGRLQFGSMVKAAKRGSKQNPDGTAHPVGSWFAIADSKERGALTATKNEGGSWFNIAHNTESGCGQNPDGRGHSGRAWFADPDVVGHLSSKSSARKAASAQIAKIPFPLSSYIARALKPTLAAVAVAIPRDPLVPQDIVVGHSKR